MGIVVVCREEQRVVRMSLFASQLLANVPQTVVVERLLKIVPNGKEVMVQIPRVVGGLLMSATELKERGLNVVVVHLRQPAPIVSVEPKQHALTPPTDITHVVAEVADDPGETSLKFAIDDEFLINPPLGVDGQHRECLWDCIEEISERKRAFQYLITLIPVEGIRVSMRVGLTTESVLLTAIVCGDGWNVTLTRSTPVVSEQLDPEEEREQKKLSQAVFRSVENVSSRTSTAGLSALIGEDAWLTPDFIPDELGAALNAIPLSDPNQQSVFLRGIETGHFQSIIAVVTGTNLSATVRRPLFVFLCGMTFLESVRDREDRFELFDFIHTSFIADNFTSSSGEGQQSWRCWFALSLISEAIRSPCTFTSRPARMSWLRESFLLALVPILRSSDHRSLVMVACYLSVLFASFAYKVGRSSEAQLLLMSTVTDMRKIPKIYAPIFFAKLRTVAYHNLAVLALARQDLVAALSWVGKLVGQRTSQ